MLLSIAKVTLNPLSVIDSRSGLRDAMTTDLPNRGIEIIPEDWDTAPASDSDAQLAEQQSRERWFEFELLPVQLEYHGDWRAFYEAKSADEAVRQKAWEEHGVEILPFQITINSYEESRARRLLQEEFQHVVRHQDQSAKDFARFVLQQLEARDYQPLAQFSAIYDEDAPDCIELTIAYLRERREEHAEAISEFNKLRQFTSVDFREPVPDTGMPAQARVFIGDSHYYIELVWCGPVLPYANGPRHAKPVAGALVRGHWKFYRIVTPNTPEPLPLQ